MRSERSENKKRSTILEEYLFGDLDLPREVPSLQDLMTVTVRRRCFRPDDQASQLALPPR